MNGELTTSHMSMSTFLSDYGDGVAEATRHAYPPRITDTQSLPPLIRAPIGKQDIAAAGLAEAVRRDGSGLAVMDMGTGKSWTSLAASAKLGATRTLIMCPPHLVEKWTREVKETVPNTRTRIINSITDFERVAGERTDRPLYVVLSREMAKLSHGWSVGVNTRYRLLELGETEEDKDFHKLDLVTLCPTHLMDSYREHITALHPHAEFRVIKRLSEYGQAKKEREQRPYFIVLARQGLDTWETRCVVSENRCPKCGAVQEKEEEGLITLEHLARAQRKCVACSEPLYQADPSGVRRYALAHYIAERYKGFFDLLIIDELHEMKAKGSAQGIAAAALAGASKGVMGLTGTLFGGYASSIFYLLLRFSRAIHADYSFTEERRFVEAFGVIERVITERPEDEQSGRNSKRKKTSVVAKEKPGVSPLLLKYILSNTVFLRLPDVSAALPDYRESVQLIEMEGAQADAYGLLEAQLVAALKETVRTGSKRLLGAYLTALLHYPDQPFKGERVHDPRDGEVVAEAPELDEATRYPKEKALLDLCRAEKAAGRRAIVYVQGMERRDITPRLHKLLSEAGLRTRVLKSTAVQARKREAWVADRVKEGLDVLIVNPKAVQTGLDLLDFPTLVFYQTEYSVYTLRQASRRSWRIGQKHAVKVVHFAYAGTLQHQAINLIAAKAKASLAMEGELVTSDLTELAEEDLMTVLARKLVEGEKAASVTEMNSAAQGDDPLSRMPDVLPVELVPRYPLVTGGGAAIGYADDELTVKGKNGKDMLIPEGTGLLFPELMGAA